VTLTFPADADVVGGLGGERGNFRAGFVSSARSLSCWHRVSCPARNDLTGSSDTIRPGQARPGRSDTMVKDPTNPRTKEDSRERGRTKEEGEEEEMGEEEEEERTNIHKQPLNPLPRFRTSLGK